MDKLVVTRCATLEGCETAPGLRGKEIGAPLVMPAMGTGVGIIDTLAIYLHTLTQTCPSGRSKEAGFDPSWFGHPLE